MSKSQAELTKQARHAHARAERGKLQAKIDGLKANQIKAGWHSAKWWELQGQIKDAEIEMAGHKVRG